MKRRQVFRRLFIEGLETRRLLAVADLAEDSVPLRGLNNDLSAGSGPSTIVEASGTGYFTASDGTGTRLWRMGGAGDAQQVLPDPIAFPGNARPTASSLQVVDGNVLFFGSEASVGIQLWRVNANGYSEVVDDVNPGIGLTGGFNSTPNTSIAVAGNLYFVANDGTNGSELWRWNTSSNRVEPVETSNGFGGINPGAGSSNPTDLLNVNGTLYFLASDGSSGVELWRVNGFTGRAEMIEDGPAQDGGIRPGIDASNPDSLTNVSGTLFFTANDGTNGTEIWRINSSGNAVMIEDSLPGGGISPGNGSSASPLIQLFNADGKLYFAANDNSTGVELWTLDASNVAQRVNAVGGGEISPGTSSSSPSNFTMSSGTLYFTATNTAAGTELWRITSTGAAELVEDAIAGDGGINSGSAPSSPTNLTDIQGTLYFAATQSGNGQELWRINATGVAAMVDDLIPGLGIAPGNLGSSPRGMIDVNGTIYFGASDGANGRELWRINSSGQAEMIDDTVSGAGIFPGAGGFLTFSTGQVPVTHVSGTVYFIANDGTNGLELWRINSSGLAEMVDDNVAGAGIAPGLDSSMRQNPTPTSNGAIAFTSAAFQNFQGTLYFRASNSVDGEELWRVNAAGIAARVEDSSPTNGLNPLPAGSNPSRFINVNNTLYFVASDEANGEELWRINGAGVAELVEDGIPGEGIRPDFTGAAPRHLTNVNGTLFFTALDGTNGIELWFINSAGIAQMVEDNVAGGGIAAGATASIVRFYDSVNFSTSLSNDPYTEIVEVNGSFFFRAQRNLTEATELWRMDSTGIASIVDAASTGIGINPSTTSGNGHANPINLINVNGTLYFSAYDGINGVELWRVNSAGIAELIEDSVAGNGLNSMPGNSFDPSTGGSMPDSLYNFNGTLYFTAYTNATGREVWRINSSGIAEIVDDAIAGVGISPGVGDSVPSPPTITFGTPIKRNVFTESNGTLYFRASDGVNGIELWKINTSGIAVMVDNADPSVGLNPGGANSMQSAFTAARILTDVAGTLYFPANDGVNGFELWRVGSSGLAERVTRQDGSEVNPGISNAIALPGSNDETPQLINANGTLYFIADNPVDGQELWRVNDLGFAEIVEDAVPGGGIGPGSTSSLPIRLHVAGNTLFFAANDGTNGTELWRVNSNGIAEMMENSVPNGGIRPGIASSVSSGISVSNLTTTTLIVAEANGTVYFNANDGSNGVELWRIQPNVAPSDIALSWNQIWEHQGIGTVVGSLSTADANAADLFTYTLVPGLGASDNSLFAISGNQIVSAVRFDFATRSSYSVRVRSTDADGAFVEKPFTINVLDALPKVIDVIGSGTSWSPAFINAVDGDGLTGGNGLGYSLDLQMGVPTAGLNLIYVQFSEPVIGFNASTISLTGVTIGNYASVPGLVSVSYDSANYRGLIQLSSPISKDRIRVGVSDAVKDVSMRSLDGDSNGIDGGIFDFRFNVLVADANNNQSVNGEDLPHFSGSFNRSVGSAQYLTRADWNGDGAVNGGDVPYFALNFNQSLPLAFPAPVTFPPPPPLFDSEEDIWATPMIDEEEIDVYFGSLDDEDEFSLS